MKVLYAAVRHYCIVLTFLNKANFEAKESKNKLKVCDTRIILRQETFKRQTQNNNSNRPPFVITDIYNPDLPNVSTAVRKNRNILQSSSRCKQIFPSPPIVAYKRSPNLGDLLVRSTLRDCSIQQEKPSPGVSKCNHPRCMPYLSIF